MLVVLSSLVVGIGLGLLRGGRPGALAALQLRAGWVFVGALAVEAVVTGWLAPNPRVPLELAGALLLLSYLAVLATVWWNRLLPGLKLIGLGVLLNFVATVPHGGLMPATPEVLAVAGRPVPSELPEPGARPYVISKDIVLRRDEIPLWAISDRFAVPRGWPLAGVFSPGDVAVAAGLAWLLAEGMAGNRKLRHGSDQADQG